MNPSPLTRTILHPRGVTLVELIVTLAIFGAVTTVLLGSFIALFSAREQTNLAQNANDDVRSILDGVEREIQAGNDIVAAGSEIRFTVSSRGDQPPYPVRYRLNGTTIEKAVGKDIAGDPCDYDPASISTWNPGTCWLPVTSPNVSISVLGFSIATSSAADGQSSPLVTVGISGTMRDSNNNTTPLTYSTSITPRNRVTVSDVAPSPASGAPVNALMNMTGAVPPGCRVSNQHYLPIDAPPPPPGGWPDLYTDCTTVNLDFTVNIPGPAGFHSMRYSGPDSAVKFGSGEIGNVPVNFSGGDALTLPLGTSTVTVVAEDLYGQTSNNSFKIQRLMVFTDPPPPPPTWRAPVYGSCGTGDITIQWNAAMFATYYEVKVDAGAWQNVGNVTSWAYTTGTPGTNYTFYLRAGNVAGVTNATPASRSYTLTGNCQCSDGADNDADTFTDFPADPGCTDANDNNEFNTWQCNNGLDDDGDGRVDFGGGNPDPGCSSATDNDEWNAPPTQCNDGVDNADPEDILIDMADPGCTDASDNDETNAACASYEFTYKYRPCPTCDVDDYTSPGYATLAACVAGWNTRTMFWPPAQPSLGCVCGGGAPVTQCNDGVDNADPEDILIDMADPGCTDASDNDETNAVACTGTWQRTSDALDAGTWNTLPACTTWFPVNPVGTPCDGSDPRIGECKRVTAYATWDYYCSGCSAVPPPPPACSDGVDNDSDGLIDFGSDPGCANADDTDETNAVAAACAPGGSLYLWNGLNWDDFGSPAWGPGAFPGYGMANQGPIIGAATPLVGSVTGVTATAFGYPTRASTLRCGAAPVTECSDGVDNADPEDILIDLADPGCANAADNNETNAVATCTLGPVVQMEAGSYDRGGSCLPVDDCAGFRPPWTPACLASWNTGTVVNVNDPNLAIDGTCYDHQNLGGAGFCTCAVYGRYCGLTPPPSVTISAVDTSIAVGEASTLNWTSTDTTSCTASVAWSGAKGTTGSESTGIINAAGSYTYTLSCSGPGGSDSNSVTITVSSSCSPSGTPVLFDSWDCAPFPGGKNYQAASHSSCCPPSYPLTNAYVWCETQAGGYGEDRPGYCGSLSPQCSDGADNGDFEDTLVDMADPGCSGPADNDETNVVSLPATPTGLTATAGACGTQMISVTWNAVAGATSYEISVDGGAWLNNGVSTIYPHIGLVPGSAHNYVVRARNAAGPSGNVAVGPTNAPNACATGTWQPVHKAINFTGSCVQNTSIVEGASCGPVGTIGYWCNNAGGRRSEIHYECAPSGTVAQCMDVESMCVEFSNCIDHGYTELRPLNFNACAPMGTVRCNTSQWIHWNSEGVCP